MEKRFNRHLEMNQFTKNKISVLIDDLYLIEDEDDKKISVSGFTRINCLYGLYDGYFYDDILKQLIKDLKEIGYKGLGIKLENIVSEVSKYKFLTEAEADKIEF